MRGLQERLFRRVSHNSAKQKCHTNVLYKSVLEECHSGMLFNSVFQERLARKNVWPFVLAYVRAFGLISSIFFYLMMNNLSNYNVCFKNGFAIIT